MIRTRRLTNCVVCLPGNCTAGYMIAGKTCEECPFDSYQDKRWQTECIPCGDQMTTARKGATSSDECIRECIVVYHYYNESHIRTAGIYLFFRPTWIWSTSVFTRPIVTRASQKGVQVCVVMT